LLLLLPLLVAQDAAWTLAVTKSGTDTTFQGFVTGQITLSNNQQVPIAIYGITNSVTNGPTATVTCGAAVPFRVRFEAVAP
jgi:hypothetical protein